MPRSQHAARNPSTYSSRNDINARLAALGLRPLPTEAEDPRHAEVFKAFCGDIDRGAICASLDTADTDAQAYEFLLARLEIALGPAHPAGRGDDAPPRVAEEVPPPQVLAGRRASVTPLHHRLPPGSRAAQAAQAQEPAQRQNEAAREERQTSRPDPRHDSRPQRRFDQHVVYGAKAAIAFDVVPVIDKESGEIKGHAVGLKAAEAIGDDCKGGVAWDDAIVTRLAPHEIATGLNVLLGKLPKLYAPHHGPANDKTISISESEGKFAGAVLVGVSQDKRRINVSVTPTDIIQVIGIFERAAVAELKIAPLLGETKMNRHAGLLLKSEKYQRSVQSQSQSQSR